MRYLLIVATLFMIVGCSTTSNSETDVNEGDEQEEVKENIISFGEIDVVVANDIIRLKGEAKSKYDQFYFTLEQADVILLDETEVELGEEVVENWRAFDLKVDINEDELDSEETPYIKLYGKEDGVAQNKHFVPVDLMEF